MDIKCISCVGLNIVCKLSLNIPIALFFLRAIYVELEKGAKIFMVLYAGFQDVWVD